MSNVTGEIHNGTVMENPVSGVRILFLKSAQDGDGRVWEVEYFIQPHGGFREPVPHVHPTSVERFEILAGVARYWLEGEESTAAKGEVIRFEPGDSHVNPWNESDDDLHMRCTLTMQSPDREALSRAEAFLVTSFEWARAGKTPSQEELIALARSLEPLTIAILPSGPARW